MYNSLRASKKKKERKKERIFGREGQTEKKDEGQILLVYSFRVMKNVGEMNWGVE